MSSVCETGSSNNIIGGALVADKFIERKIDSAKAERCPELILLIGHHTPVEIRLREISYEESLCENLSSSNYQ